MMALNFQAAKHKKMIMERTKNCTVRLGDEREGQYPVLEGLVGGETVVLAPPARLRDGAAVKPEAK